jgi:hypothetical protein
MSAGEIEAWIYDQEGNRQPFLMADTQFNRDFAEWLRIHDRYTPSTKGQTDD